MFYEQAPKKSAPETEDAKGEVGEVKEGLLQQVEDQDVSVELMKIKDIH